MKFPLLTAALCGLLSCAFIPKALADYDDSPLGKFEEGAEKHSPPPPASPQPSSGPWSQPAPSPYPAAPPSSSGNDAQWDDGDDGPFKSMVKSILDDFFHATAGHVGHQMQRTFLRLSDSPLNTEPHHDGDSLIPVFRADYSQQNVSSRIDGNFLRLEGGWGPGAMMLETYILRDTAANATLRFNRLLAMYRYSPDRVSEYDLGIGQTDMIGTELTQLFTMSLAVRYMFGDHLTLELRPTWAETISDYEASLAWTLHYGSLKAGYRSMSSAGGTLQGPFLGIAVHF